MDRRSLLRIPQASFRAGFAVVAAALALSLATIPPAFAEDTAPAASDQQSSEQCLACHGEPGMEKKLGDGAVLQLHIPGDMFGKSVHSAIGCTGCHYDIDINAHPPEKNDIPSARTFSIQMIQVCRGCHADRYDQWQSSIHAALVRSSNPAAPVCTDCHNPHAVIKGAAATVEQAPCQKCHKDIYTAYLGSMHGKARLKSAESIAPICSDCHSAHAVKPTSYGEGPIAACFGCHEGLLESHQKWLPNAALHFEVVSCPACHAPKAQRKVDLMLMDSKDAQPLEMQEAGVPLFEASAKSGAGGIDAQGLANLIQTLNQNGLAGRTVLRGRLEPATGPEAHQLTDKSQAISDCKTCHSASSPAFQSVTVSVVQPQGQRVVYAANADVLTSVVSVNSIGGFYAIGGTRIKLLDILLILAILGGVGFAVGHIMLGWIFKYLGLYHPAIGGHAPGDKAGDGHGPKPA